MVKCRQSTLRYGSDDAGRHVHMEDEELNEKMKLAGERLNLAGHVTGSSSDATKIIYGPGDIEGHRGHVSRNLRENSDVRTGRKIVRRGYVR